MPADEETTEIIEAVKAAEADEHPVTVVVVAPERAVDLTPYITPGLPPPAGLNDLGIAWSHLDPGVMRAYAYLRTLPHRDPAEIARRAAVLLSSPEEVTGTPARCYECHRIYLVAPDEVDWRIAGREDGLCFHCTTTMPPPERVLEGVVVDDKPAIEGT